ncbi:MAG: hypothetical protein K2I83_00565, partial [Bacteroidales bacterium]|nr:hypothetical protein [Bacteroidales bacterium]
MELTDQEIFRRQAKETLEQMGINPYPAPTFEVNVTAAEILEKFPKDNTLFQEVSIAGRLMSRRVRRRLLRRPAGRHGTHPAL